MRNVPRSRFRLHYRLRWPRLLPDGEAVLQPVGNQQVERAFNDDRHVAVRNLVAQQVLSLLELIVQAPARSELHLVAVGTERCDGGQRRRRRKLNGRELNRR